MAKLLICVGFGHIRPELGSVVLGSYEHLTRNQSITNISIHYVVFRPVGLSSREVNHYLPQALTLLPTTPSQSSGGHLCLLENALTKCREATSVGRFGLVSWIVSHFPSRVWTAL
jgi:hypothetical protein